jgi:hypothetical protein
MAEPHDSVQRDLDELLPHNQVVHSEPVWDRHGVVILMWHDTLSCGHSDSWMALREDRHGVIHDLACTPTRPCWHCYRENLIKKYGKENVEAGRYHR